MNENNLLNKKIFIGLTLLSVIIIISLVYFFWIKTKNKTTNTSSQNTISIVPTIKKEPYDVLVKIAKSADFIMDNSGNIIFNKNDKIPLVIYVDSKKKAVTEFSFTIEYDSKTVSFLQNTKKNLNSFFDVSYKENNGILTIIGKKKKEIKKDVVFNNEALVSFSFISLDSGSVSFLIKNDTSKNLIANSQGKNMFKEAMGLTVLIRK